MGIQDKINEMFREKERQDREKQELVAKITGEARQTSDALIEEVKKQQLITQLIDFEELTEEERKYCQSPYFQNYIRLITEYIDVLANNIKNKLIEQYSYNNYYFDNPFYREINTKELISDIGFPIPTKFMNKIGMLIVDKLEDMKISELLGIDCEVSITSYEYVTSNDKNNNLKSGNVIKKSDSYIVTVKAKQIEDIKDKQIK